MQKRRDVCKFQEFTSSFSMSKKTTKKGVLWRRLAFQGRVRGPQGSPKGSKKGSQKELLVDLVGAFSLLFAGFFEGSCNFSTIFSYAALRYALNCNFNAFFRPLETLVNTVPNDPFGNFTSPRDLQKPSKWIRKGRPLGPRSAQNVLF